jgi:hypothetical protein
MRNNKKEESDSDSEEGKEENKNELKSSQSCEIALPPLQSYYYC